MAKRQKPSDAFVERPQEETQTSKSRRISLRVDDSGAIDWTGASDEQKEAFYSAVTSDPDTLLKVAASVEEGGEGEVVGPVTEDHVKIFLKYYGKAEAFIVPAIIKKKSKGLVKVDPAIAEKTFEFSDEELNSMAPDGAEFANKEIIPNLPEWLSKWIFELGPGEKFLGAMAFHTWMRTMALMDYLKTQPQTVDASVATVPSAASPVGEVVQP